MVLDINELIIKRYAWIAIAILLAIASPGAREADLLPRELPGTDIPLIREHTYRMAGRVRMLLVWIGRDDVGTGVIRWRASEKGTAYELLIGSDPLRAPGSLNRWGYLAEEVRGEECAVLGVISKSEEERLSDVGGIGPADRRPFKSLRSRVTEKRAYVSLATVHTSSSHTYRDADAVLKLAFGEVPSTVRQIDRPAGVRSGFLSSVAEFIQSSINQSNTGKTLTNQQVRYVYGDTLYELRLLEAVPLARFEKDGRVFANVIRARFDTGEAGARSRSRFELVYGTTGALAGVPILISYQPQWWLQVDLVIEA